MKINVLDLIFKQLIISVQHPWLTLRILQYTNRWRSFAIVRVEVRGSRFELRSSWNSSKIPRVSIPW